MNEEYNLIQAARNGDQAAFGELVRQYQKRVFALAVRMCPTPELAEEAGAGGIPRRVGRACPFSGGIPPLPHGSIG